MGKRMENKSQYQNVFKLNISEQPNSEEKMFNTNWQKWLTYWTWQTRRIGW